MRRIQALALAVLVTAASLPLSHGGPVEAGTAVRLDLAGLVGEADLVLEGRVVAQRVLLTAPGRIETESTLAVARTFLGEPEPRRTIRLPGGVLPDGRGMTIPGLPAIASGEEVLLLLSRPNRDGMRMPVGLAQGCLRVVLDRAGTKRLVRDQRDLVLVDAAGGAAPAPASAADLDYARTVLEIEAAVAAKRARAAAGTGR